MAIEKQLAKHLKKLNRAIQKIVARSSEFSELRKMLREDGVELAIYVVPLIGGRPAGEELRFELTESDRYFLKQAGIRFET
ncbi:MAG: hypothetical protein HYY90_03005 [Candidatus Omnitrophica bacterium]|nr:hypothetical protein [Candidatus Omnitrophota bacterium]MBI2495730.1 hypothetical protein [Candidatus Omnitrophota bacterium]MBI3022017.1 hypothetical protein [Candidatus Omnitrophota bacterium]MBI3083316.1 hypothetical protein [Candidatus Omnitrophota bacterium]